MRKILSLALLLALLLCTHVALAQTPRSAEDFYNRGVERLMREDYAGALADHDRAIKLAPANAGYYGGRAHLKLVFLGDYEGAVADASKAIELGPGGEFAYEHHA